MSSSKSKRWASTKMVWWSNVGRVPMLVMAANCPWGKVARQMYTPFAGSSRWGGGTKFAVGKITSDPEADRLIRKTDQLGRPYNDYVAWYEANPWVVDAVRRNPCGPAGKALAVMLNEGFYGLQVEHKGTKEPTPKPEFQAVLSWWLSHLSADDLARLPKPVKLKTPTAIGCGGGRKGPPHRGSSRPSYVCPATGQLV